MEQLVDITRSMLGVQPDCRRSVLSMFLCEAKSFCVKYKFSSHEEFLDTLLANTQHRHGIVLNLDEKLVLYNIVKDVIVLE